MLYLLSERKYNMRIKTSQSFSLSYWMKEPYMGGEKNSIHLHLYYLFS